MALKWISLNGTGSTMEDEGDEAGKQTTTVVVPAGHPDAGTYSTNNKNLADDAHEAKKTPGAEVRIQVDTSSNEIKMISTRKTF